MGATFSRLIARVLSSSRPSVLPTTGASASMAPPSQRPSNERNRSEAYMMGVKAVGSEMASVSLLENKKVDVSVRRDASPSQGIMTRAQGTQKSSTGTDGIARIIALSPVQTVVLGPDLKILEISKSYLAATGLKREACIGQDIFDYARQINSGVSLMQLRSELQAAIDTRETRRLDPYKDTHGKAWRTRFVPIYDEEERELLYVVAEREQVLMRRTPPSSDENYTNETYRILVNNVKDYAIFMLDTDGYIFTWNSGAQILKQYKAEEIIGRHFSTFYGEEDNANHKPEKELEICMKDGKVEDEGWRYKKDGTRFWASVTIAPVYKDAVHIGFSKVTRDLTERKAAETRLIAAFEEASKLKSDFLANMSHEIRTPMHGMLTACSLLMDTGLSVEQKELAQIIRESGAILLQVINDILDYSKLASGSFTVNSTKISILDITNAVVKSSRATLKPGVEIGAKLDTRLPKNVQSDPLRFRQVLGNLVGNAVKFTEKGSITIVTTLTENDDDACTLLTEVVDTGIGVPNHAVDALFTPFAQFDSSATKRYKGTGLGLSICKSLVELMGGTIGFRPSDNGTGSTFWFTTRLAKISQATLNRPPTLSESPSAMLSPTSEALTKNILVVEDNSINRTIMVKLLKNYGFSSIDVASHGLEALNLIKRKPLAYSLVLMDINMPVMDGMKATKEIRGMGLDVPIIAMTANALKGDEERFLDQGMNDYISKPVDRRGVLRVILRWLEH